MGRHPNSADCIGLWRMDEASASDNAVDVSATANNGVQTGTPPPVAGLFGSGRDMSLGSRVFTTGVSAAYGAGVGEVVAITLSAWVYYSGTPPASGKKATIFNTYNSVTDGMGLYLNSSGVVCVRRATSGSNADYVSATTLSAGWHHLAVTYKCAAPAATILYVDGVAETLHSTTGSYGYFGAGFGVRAYLGNRYTDQANCFWRGYIDDLALYNTVKDSSWIADIFDITPPNIANRDPGPDEEDVAIDATISLDLIDAESGVDAATVIIVIGGVAAWSSGAIQPGFTGSQTPIANGYRYAITRTVPFDYSEEILVDVSANDVAENRLTTAYSFTTREIMTPYLDSLNPASGATSVPKNAPIMLNILDDESTVVPTSVKIYVQGRAAYLEGFVQAGFSVQRSTLTKGYGYLITRLDGGEYGGAVPVNVIALNVAGGRLETTYTFTTKSFAIEEETEFDLDLDSTGDIYLVDKDLPMIGGKDLVEQRLLIKLRMFAGEWFRNYDAGMPYWRDILVEAPNSKIVEAAFRKAIIEAWGVASLSAFAMTLDKTTRQVDVTFTAISSYGSITVDLRA